MDNLFSNAVKRQKKIEKCRSRSLSSFPFHLGLGRTMELGERKNGSKKEARTQWERMEKIRGRISQPAVCFGISAPMSPITFFPFFRFFFFLLVQFFLAHGTIHRSYPSKGCDTSDSILNIPTDMSVSGREFIHHTKHHFF